MYWTNQRPCIFQEIFWILQFHYLVSVWFALVNLSPPVYNASVPDLNPISLNPLCIVMQFIESLFLRPEIPVCFSLSTSYFCEFGFFRILNHYFQEYLDRCSLPNHQFQDQGYFLRIEISKEYGSCNLLFYLYIYRYLGPVVIESTFLSDLSCRLPIFGNGKKSSVANKKSSSVSATLSQNAYHYVQYEITSVVSTLRIFMHQVANFIVIGSQRNSQLLGIYKSSDHNCYFLFPFILPSTALKLFSS